MCVHTFPYTGLPCVHTALLRTVQLVLPQLQQQEQPAILVTNGCFSLDDPQQNAMSVRLGFAVQTIQGAAKQKLTGLLHEQLKPLGVYAGEEV